MGCARRVHGVFVVARWVAGTQRAEERRDNYEIALFLFVSFVPFVVAIIGLTTKWTKYTKESGADYAKRAGKGEPATSFATGVYTTIACAFRSLEPWDVASPNRFINCGREFPRRPQGPLAFERPDFRAPTASAPAALSNYPNSFLELAG